VDFRVSLWVSFRASLRAFRLFYGFSEVYGFSDACKMLNKGFICSQGTTTYPRGDVCKGVKWHALEKSPDLAYAGPRQ